MKYYYIAAVTCVFKGDFTITWKDNETEEVSLPEFIELALRYGYKLPHQDKEIYYYAGKGGTVYKSDKPDNDAIELTPAEYIDLSIYHGINQNDTLL